MSDPDIYAYLTGDSEPLSREKRGCRECFEVEWHIRGCGKYSPKNVYPVLDAERSTGRHKFVGQYGLGNKFCAYPVGLHQCGQPRDAEIHHVHDFSQIEGQSSTQCECGAVPNYYDSPQPQPEAALCGKCGHGEGTYFTGACVVSGCSCICWRRTFLAPGEGDAVCAVCGHDDPADVKGCIFIENGDNYCNCPSSFHIIAASPVEAAAVTEAPLTVEAALEELRELFPHGSFQIIASSGLPRFRLLVLRKSHLSVHTMYEAETLADGMRQVREYAERISHE